MVVVPLDGWCVEVSAAQLTSAVGMGKGMPEEKEEGSALATRDLRAMHRWFVLAISTWPSRPRCELMNLTNATNQMSLTKL